MFDALSGFLEITARYPPSPSLPNKPTIWLLRALLCRRTLRGFIRAKAVRMGFNVIIYDA